MKKIVYLLIMLLSISTLTGCNLFTEKTNKDSEVVKVKNTMVDKLDNFSYSATIETETSVGSIPTTLECIQDNVNQLTYCKTTTVAVSIDEYIDIKNKKIYTKTLSILGGDNNNAWVVSDYNGDLNSSNSWLSLSDYIFDLEVEEKDGGKYYTGIISSKKLGEAMSNTDSSLKTNKLVNKDIPISIFINSSNYIEYMNFEMEILGIKQKVTINYTNFNQANTITIPKEAKQ